MPTKKLHPPSVPPLIPGIFILSLVYWLYLSVTTRMDIAFDSVDYASLGRILHTHGWISYFTTGPNREPIYPCLISISMSMEHVTGLAYVKIMAFFGVMIMFLTQVLTYKILRLLNIRNGICALVLAYMALSPALNNAAFSLYSEIAAFPFILGIILTGNSAWEAVQQNKKQDAFFYGALLGLLFAAATLTKAVFECITPVFLIFFFTMLLLRDNGFKIKKITASILCVAAALSFFYVPVTGYKWFNLRYNGNFVITSRGSWALYGNTARRMEPLTSKRLAEALAFAPGEGVCDSLFGQKECNFWSFQKSDQLGSTKIDELNSQHLSHEKINTTFLGLSVQKALENPFQYTLLTFVEGTKMLFWESTKIGFVHYPHWLQKIYDIKIFNNGLRFLVFLITGAAVISLWLEVLTLCPSPPGFCIGLMIFLYILFFSFFFILTRYALPIAPLYLIAIGIWINKLTPKK